MYELHFHETPISVRIAFREASRRILQSANVPELHIKRIRIGAQFQSSEAVQGALADYFYTCWYEIISDNSKALEILDEVRDRLNSKVQADFYACIEKKQYINRTSRMATSWSVFVSPSMDVAQHLLRTNKQHTMRLVDAIIHELTEAKEKDLPNEIYQIEEKFFEHCLVCDDLMAFMKAWFRLNKINWTFDDRWQNCRMQLEESVSAD